MPIKFLSFCNHYYVKFLMLTYCELHYLSLKYPIVSTDFLLPQSHLCLCVVKKKGVLILKFTGIQLGKSHLCLCVKYVPLILGLELEYECTSLAKDLNLHLHTVLLVSFGRTTAQWFLGNYLTFWVLSLTIKNYYKCVF